MSNHPRSREPAGLSAGLALSSLCGIVLLGGCSAMADRLALPQTSPAADGTAGSPPVHRSDWPLSPRTVDPSVSMDDLVSSNLVDILVQVLPPVSTTIQTLPHSDAFGQSLIARLVQAGYGIQRVETDLGAHLLHYERRSVEEPGKPAQGVSYLHYSLAVGDIELDRQYRLDTVGRVVPDSTVQLAGSRMPVQVDDTIFPAVDAAAINSVALARVEHVAPELAPDDVPALSLITPAVVRRVARSVSHGTSLSALNSSQVEVHNRFYSGGPSFGGIAQSHETVAEMVVIFPNDSLRLGEQGKLMIRQFADQYRERTDMISVVGCSNGYTALAIGNEGLALGRSKRVSEELMAQGIGREHILDEGCWAPRSAGDRFPSRGVVMELLRRSVS